MDYARLVHGVATALLAGPWEHAALVARMATTLGSQHKWIDKFVDGVLANMGGPHPPEFQRLFKFLRHDESFFRLSRQRKLKIVQYVMTPTPMSPRPGVQALWPVPTLTTEDDICRWLTISPEHLSWLADVHSRERSRPRGPLRHYNYKWIRKRSGGWRLLEIPKSRLKEIQRHILSELLDKIPVHANAHGFVRNASIKSFVTPHAQQALAIHMDLKDFFMSIQASRVHAMFRTVGYPECVARILTGLCTNSVPSPAMRLPVRTEILPGYRQTALRTPHLPQGAPTSPALANLCAHRFDDRVSALARKFDWYYTRYADDLLFSGSHASSKFLLLFQTWVGAIAIEEHLKINADKTRIMGRGRRQHAAGLVFNQKPNLARESFDQLKAILHNCVKQGPATQNRENHEHFQAHLLGRVTHVADINPGKGERLQRLYDRIQWTAAQS